jgi:hypothetical protein
MAQQVTFMDVLRGCVHFVEEGIWTQRLVQDFGLEAVLLDCSSEQAYKIHHHITEKILSDRLSDHLQLRLEKVKIFHLVHAFYHISSIEPEVERTTKMDLVSLFFSVQYNLAHLQDSQKWVEAEKGLSCCQNNYVKSRALLVIADGYREDNAVNEAKRVLKDAVTLALSISDEQKKNEVLKAMASDHLEHREKIEAEEVTMLIPDYEDKLLRLIAIANRYISEDNFGETSRILKRAYDFFLEVPASERNKNVHFSFIINHNLSAMAENLIVKSFESCLEKNNLTVAESIAVSLPESDLYNKNTFLERLVDVYKEKGDLVNARRIASMISNGFSSQASSSISDSENSRAKRRRLEPPKKDGPTT